MEAVSHFVELDPTGPERLFYDQVTQAVRRYALERGIGDGFLLSPPQRQMSSCMHAAARSWADRSSLFDTGSQLYEDFGVIEPPTQGVGPLIDYIAGEVLPDFEIDSLRKHDSKFARFRTIVSDFLARSPTEKLIVFSYFKATLSYLHERLSSPGYSISSVCTGA